MRILGAAGAVLVYLTIDSSAGDPAIGRVALAIALMTMPIDLLPALIVVTVRSPGTVLGPFNTSDVIALAYLARILAGLHCLDIRVTRSAVALLAFLVTAALVTTTGGGLVTALGRITLYAAVGVAATHRPSARTWLLAGVVAFALVTILLYLPHFPERLFGSTIHDPSHAGALFIAALVIVCTAPLQREVKALLGTVLLFGIVMTETRSIWFATAAVGLAAILPRRWYLPVLLPPVLSLVAFPFISVLTGRLGLNPASGDLRIRSMAIGLHEFRDSPIIGHGWAFTSSVAKFGLTGWSSQQIYNLWINLGVCTGVVGIAAFLLFVAFLAHEAADDPVAYLFLLGVLAISLAEMPLYGNSLSGALFLILTVPRRPRRGDHDHRHRATRRRVIAHGGLHASLS